MPIFRTKSKIKFKNFFGETESQDYLDVEKRLDLARETTIDKNVQREAENPLTREEYILQSNEQGAPIVDSTRYLSQESVVRQKNILKEFGPEWSKDIEQIEKGKSENIERKQEEESFKDNVFFEKEIQEVCVDFNLRFLPVKKLAYYDSDFKYDLAREMDTYCSLMRKNNGVDYESKNFYALAIEEDFAINGNKKPKSKKPTLIMFYKTNSQKNTFVHVKTWGEQKYSRLRYLKAWMKKNPQNYFTAITLQLSGVLMLLTSAMGFGIALSTISSFALGALGGWYISSNKIDSKKKPFFTETAFNKV